MERLSKKGLLYAFKHRFFWQCMDTKRDKDLFDNLFKQKNYLGEIVKSKVSILMNTYNSDKFIKESINMF